MISTILAESKVEELDKSLIRKNADIYVERSKKTESQRESLCTWKIVDLQIRALADRSLHGKENVVRLLQSFNRET